MLPCALVHLVALLAPQIVDGPADDRRRVDLLIARITDENVPWDSRCAAEDELAKLTPEMVMPRLLAHAAKPMPDGGIYNSLGRDSERDIPFNWQVWYALGRSWSAQARRLPVKTGGDLLVGMLNTAQRDAERNLVVRELHSHWTPSAEAPAAKILRDKNAAKDLRVATAWALVARGKQSYLDDLLEIFDALPHADRFDWIEVMTSRRSKQKSGVDSRVVNRGFELLQQEDQQFKKEVAKRGDAFHGAYFATNWLADYVGENFQPNADDPRYNNTGRRDPRWFADTVANALMWWIGNQARFVKK